MHAVYFCSTWMISCMHLKKAKIGKQRACPHLQQRLENVTQPDWTVEFWNGVKESGALSGVLLCTNRAALGLPCDDGVCNGKGKVKGLWIADLIVRYLYGDLNSGPFDDRTVFKHLNTAQVCYSDPHCLMHQKKKEKITHEHSVIF